MLSYGGERLIIVPIRNLSSSTPGFLRQTIHYHARTKLTHSFLLLHSKWSASKKTHEMFSLYEIYLYFVYLYAPSINTFTFVHIKLFVKLILSGESSWGWDLLACTVILCVFRSKMTFTSLHWITQICCFPCVQKIHMY